MNLLGFPCYADRTPLEHRILRKTELHYTHNYKLKENHQSAFDVAKPETLKAPCWVMRACRGDKSQREHAEALGVTERTVRRWEKRGGPHSALLLSQVLDNRRMGEAEATITKNQLVSFARLLAWRPVHVAHGLGVSASAALRWYALKDWRIPGGSAAKLMNLVRIVGEKDGRVELDRLLRVLRWQKVDEFFDPRRESIVKGRIQKDMERAKATRERVEDRGELDRLGAEDRDRVFLIVESYEIDGMFDEAEAYLEAEGFTYKEYETGIGTIVKKDGDKT